MRRLPPAAGGRACSGLSMGSTPGTRDLLQRGTSAGACFLAQCCSLMTWGNPGGLVSPLGEGGRRGMHKSPGAAMQTAQFMQRDAGMQVCPAPGAPGGVRASIRGCSGRKGRGICRPRERCRSCRAASARARRVTLPRPPRNSSPGAAPGGGNARRDCHGPPRLGRSISLHFSVLHQ